MDDKTIRQAWEECSLEEVEKFNGSLIDPAVFEPQMEESFMFEERPCGDLWESIKSMDEVSFMSEPLDGFLRGSAYVWIGEDSGQISFKSYSNRIKISPADKDCSYEAFKHFIVEFEKNVCELEFLGGLDHMETE